jgi:hypothetical protein
MKRDPRQLSLFQQPAAGRSFTLEPSPDLIVLCLSCGQQIVAWRRNAQGVVVSEYVSRAGECFDCAHHRPAKQQ